jgi:hypothetical protein
MIFPFVERNKNVSSSDIGIKIVQWDYTFKKYHEYQNRQNMSTDHVSNIEFHQYN